MGSNERKSSKLGMPFGTASGKLRKQILFHLVTKYKENLCYRCSTQIETVDELSIEHKTGWENSDNPIDSFFDLDNIAFSHLNCNVSAPRNYSEQGINNIINSNKEARKSKKMGYAWCSLGQHEVVISSFSKNKYNHNGLEHNCKECRASYRSKIL